MVLLLTRLLGGLFLGWGIGANNSADIFGTAVATHSVRFRTAVVLIAVFAFAGSVVEGHRLYPAYHFSGDITENLGLSKGVRTVNSRMLATIFCGWVLTPAVSAVLAIGLAAALRA